MAHRVPTGLGEAGKKLWKAIVKNVEFRPDELTVLESACAMADQIAEYKEYVADEPMTVRGSAGQLVAHPIRVEIRALQSAQAVLLGKLDIPDDNEEDPMKTTQKQLNRSQAARKAVSARWKM